MKLKTAIAKINKNGVLLVFPITNKKEPNSLWSEFYPRTKMRWEWDESGDNRVADMWRLMKRLSSCREVVYSKWYQGRATFFSREFFSALLCLMNGEHNTPLSRPAQTILETLEMDSPLSTKQIKAATDLQGRYNEPVYGKAMKELFSRLLIVGFGEVEDGAFPSLAVGATQVLYEDLFLQAQEMPIQDATKIVNQSMPAGSAFLKFFHRICSKNRAYYRDETSSSTSDLR